MDVSEINPKSVAEAVNGIVNRDGSVLCYCPIHEASGVHTPSLVLSITDERRILVHCRSKGCDKKQFHAIKAALVRQGLPEGQIGGTRKEKELPAWDYYTDAGVYTWTKQKQVSKAGRKSFTCGVWDHGANDWITRKRPDEAPMLFNLQAIAPVLAAAPERPLLVVEGEKDVVTATELGVLATTCADGAGKWRIDDTRTLLALGLRAAIVCPDNDGPGIEHGVAVAKSLQQAGVAVQWLELPELGAKQDLSDWAPKQIDAKGALAELIAKAPPFDEASLGWRARLKAASPRADHLYRGDIPNLMLALEHEPRLKGCFAWNDFRHRVEVRGRTPWCQLEWWGAAYLTPTGNRALRDADLAGLGAYLTGTYDFGACSMTIARAALHAVAEAHLFDELLDWIEQLPEWDGTARLDDWLVAYAGADTEAHCKEYLALIGAKYLMQVLNRAIHPGAQADYALALIAGQGAYKDQMLRTMFSPYYHEGLPSPRASQADFALGLAGAIVAHAAEMAAWRKADIEDQKAVLTRCVDHGRRAYGYESRDYPRRCCLAFSTNDVDALQDATGDRRYWPITIRRDRVDLEALRRDRDQLLAEALTRLQAGERHWPTHAEEERLIEPERRPFMTETALEIVAVLERFLVEKPLTTRPNKESYDWKWERREQPLREVYLDAFFEQCFGMYAAVRRQGLDRASKRDISYCTTWLRSNGWRRVQTRQPDEQRVMVWRVHEGPRERNFQGNPSSDVGCATAKEKGVAGGVADQQTPGSGFCDAGHGQDDPKVSAEISANALIALKKGGHTQNNLHNDLPGEIFSKEEREEFSHVILIGKSCLGVPAFDALLPATLDQLETVFPRDRFLALDMETSGLSAVADGVRTVQFADGENVALFIFDHPVPACALVVLADFLRERRVVVHNARFEGSWLRLAGIDVVLDDTALLFSAVRGMRYPGKRKDKHRDQGGGRIGLADLVLMVLGETLDKSEQTSDWSLPTLTASQLTYALTDAIVTHRVWEALWSELQVKAVRFGVDIASGYEDLRFSAAMARNMEQVGIGFDTAAHRAWMDGKLAPVAALKAHLAALEPALTPSCLASGVQLDALFRKRIETYAPQEQRRALLAWPKTGTTRRLSFGHKELAEVIVAECLPPAEQQLVEALYVRADQVRGLSTFGEGFASHVVAGRLHGQLHAGGAVTGRYTSTNPNLQNIPTDPVFRRFFCAPEGRLLVDVDYSQLELRVFASLSNEVKMIAAFEDGWDYHDLIVQRVGCDRRQAKAINFGIIFGMGVSTLAASLGVDDVTAGEYLRAWDEQAPTGAQWRSDRPHLYVAERGVRTARRWIDYLDDDRADETARTRPMNYPVQGGAGDVMHRAMRLLFERYRDWPGAVLPVLSIHDEILVEVDAACASEVGVRLADLMVEAYCDVLPNGPTKFLAIPGVGTTWAAAKEDGKKREEKLREGR
jgi:DNA polymerase I-like protein with 3'-5' exonuclease and polymerase domains/predicted P-loop ATPase